MQKAVFFDRDGTLNHQVNGYVWTWDQFKWRLGAVSAIKAANSSGYLSIIVTNQAGVAYGHYREQDIIILHDAMSRDLARHGAHIDGIFVCPHHPSGKVVKHAYTCECRKPKPGLLLSAIEMFDINPRESFLIGDQVSDIQAASAAGVNGVLLKTWEDVGIITNRLVRTPLSGSLPSQPQAVA